MMCVEHAILSLYGDGKEVMPAYHLVFLHYFRENLELMRELNERAAQGRACGNLGNTHYLLGNFQQAIHYHEEVSCIGWDSVLDRMGSWGC
jgi:Tetratricopeptide repeat.